MSNKLFISALLIAFIHHAQCMESNANHSLTQEDQELDSTILAMFDIVKNKGLSLASMQEARELLNKQEVTDKGNKKCKEVLLAGFDDTISNQEKFVKSAVEDHIAKALKKRSLHIPKGNT